ncbi:hypothetical protein [Salegentibacter maritimus]|uniref:hypothetical protein n=1 Tax=Salegentibacter maritimus TaxID=2794347 RepID=UPI0018E45A23|nr:hypothetical protein [Salegentibacter maritimus]MBI6117960.1 hypothetical protein [Salegentibacter maritimus]
MILIHHSLSFWENSNNWIEPKSFDTLFTIVLSLYLILTFIPDFVKYFKVSSLVGASKIQKHSYSIIQYLVNQVEEEVNEKKQVLQSTFSNLLSNVDVNIILVEEKLNNLWKKYIYFHLLIVLTCLGYLIFSACFNSQFEIHRIIFTCLLIVILLPFVISLIHAMNIIDSEIKIIEKNMKKLSLLHKAYRNGKTKGACDFISKNEKDYLN